MNKFVGMLHNLMLKLPYLGKNTCEEGSESRFGFEESLNVFRTLHAGQIMAMQKRKCYVSIIYYAILD